MRKKGKVFLRARLLMNLRSLVQVWQIDYEISPSPEAYSTAVQHQQQLVVH